VEHPESNAAAPKLNQHMASDEVVRILGKLMLEQRSCQPIHRGWRYGEQQEATDQLQCPVDPLEDEAHSV
jgi:hypothetical protein